eukprot:753522-Hanusia_phi.AAC.7
MPSPCKAQQERMQRLIPSHPVVPSDRTDVLDLEQTFMTCDPTAQCTMAFVSKVGSRKGEEEEGEGKQRGRRRRRGS